VSFVDRGYEDVVRDVLTSLTSGVAGERAAVGVYDASARPASVPDVVLKRRPVRRVSRVAGVLAPLTPGGDPVPSEFSLNDYELVAGPEDPRDLSTIRFLPFGRKPASGSELTVNYYPRNVEPSPVTDVNVGSVARTLVEAVSRELAGLYAQINLAYDSGFLETATGSSLDRVVALLGVERYRAGRPLGLVVFSRRAGSAGTISLPPGIPVTDAADKLRYETSEAHTMLPNESTAEVRVRGASADTPTVKAGTLSVVQRAIAGIDAVTNPTDTVTAVQDESDDELRARARGALTSSNKGTIGAIENGLLQMPEVRAVSLVEFPNGVPGELKLSVSLTDATLPALPADVLAKIEELRPAGVRVLAEMAGKTELRARLGLVLAGGARSAADVERLHGVVAGRLAGLVAKSGVGQRIRTGPLVRAILADEPIVDATLQLGLKTGPIGRPGEDFLADAGAIVELAEVDIGFDQDTFDTPPVGGPAVPVDVTAIVPVVLAPGAAIAAVQTQIEARLRKYFGALAPAATVTADALLNLLRDESLYTVDRLGLHVTLAAGPQFVEVADGGPTFTVLIGQTFNVSKVTVPGGAPA
jgi:hypothetical protein